MAGRLQALPRLPLGALRLLGLLQDQLPPLPAAVVHVDVVVVEAAAVVVVAAVVIVIVVVVGGGHGGGHVAGGGGGGQRVELPLGGPVGAEAGHLAGVVAPGRRAPRLTLLPLRLVGLQPLPAGGGGAQGWCQSGCYKALSGCYKALSVL